MLTKNFGAKIPWEAVIWRAENSVREALRWEVQGIEYGAVRVFQTLHVKVHT
jgi:hypothetical protein